MPSEVNVRLLVRVALGLLVLLCALRLGLGTKPWETEVAARHAAGKPAGVDDYMAAGFWFGCLFSGTVALALLATSRWWLREGEVEKCQLVRQGEAAIPRKLFWMVLIGVLVVAAIPRVPRMGHSFWGDEDWAYRDLIGGRFREAQDGSLKFKRHPWKTTAFWDKGTNNQYAYTLVARVCHDGWKRLSGAPPEAFSEAALRTPSLLAGLGSIVMGALLLRRLGFSRAALFLAALMAIHPWHVRYSSEARGYTMLIFFLLAGIYFLIAALEDGRWRWWLLFALFEFLSLYTWKAALHPIAMLNLGVLVVLLVKRRREYLQYWRWLVVNLFVLMAFVPLFAPAIPQIKRKLAVSTQAKGEMGTEWFQNVFSQLLTGTDYIRLGTMITWVVAPLGLACLLLGIWRLRRSAAIWLLLAPLAGGAFAFVHFTFSGNELLKWYVFYTLPFLLILIALGIASLRLWAVGVGIVAIYLAGSFGVLKSRMFVPIQLSRESSERTRNDAEGLLHMGSSNIVTVGLYRVSHAYDPRMRQGSKARTGEALMKVVKECRAGGRELYVNASNLGYARLENSDFMAVVEDPKLFRQTGDFPAAEGYLEIRTYQMLPADGE